MTTALQIASKYLNKDNNMRWRTCFSSISYYGYKVDIVKSGIQKYLRRREYDKMLWCVCEMWLFQGMVDESKLRATSGLISNLVNRLVVMCDEEMLFVDYERYILVREYLDRYNNNRDDLVLLLKVCDILCNSRILRRCSDLRAYFGRNMGINRQIAPPANVLDSMQKGNFLKSVMKEDMVSFINFKYYFEMSDIYCMYWALKIFYSKNDFDGEVKEIEIKEISWDKIVKEDNKKIKNKKIKKRENVYNVWKYLLNSKYVENNRIVRKCLEYRLRDFDEKKKKERFMFMTSAIDLVLMVKKKNMNEKDMMLSTERFKEEFEGIWTTEYCNSMVEKLFKDREYLVMDDYVVDMHTSLGRKMKKNKEDFATEGGLVVNEDKEYFVKEWRDLYVNEKIIYEKNMAKKRLEKENKKLKKEEKKENKKEEKENKKEEKENKKEEEKKENLKKEEKKEKIKKENKKEEIENNNKKKAPTARAQQRAEKYKKIKKLRGKPNFDDLEKDLKFIDYKNIDVNKIRLCTENTCGNKVMCFEYDGKIWKEGRESMNYNRDYCVIDECKELFGLKKIGMERILSNFRIEKVDKSKKSWVDNWKMVGWGGCNGDNKDIKNKVVYCVMDKIVPGIEFGKRKKEMLENRKMLKEFVKIGVFRGIFRVSDFNGRNVLIKNGLNNNVELVSIDEGDIGKRLDIIGGREKWLIDEINKDKSIINEIINELKMEEDKVKFVMEKMKEYKFGDGLCDEVKNNWVNLKKDLESEGIEFE